MYGNANMYANMMAQQGGSMMGGQTGAQMPNAGQVSQMGNQQSTPQTGMTPMGQQSTGNAMMGSMPGMAAMTGMPGMGMSGMNAMPSTGMNSQPAGVSSAFTPGMQGLGGVMGQQGMSTGIMGQQNMGAGMIGQQGAAPGLMGQQGMNPAMANWQAMAAQNPQALAAMQAYMQQYAIRMAAYQRMAAAASASGMGAPGFGHGPGAMGAMGGMVGSMGHMGMLPGMGAGGMGPGQQHLRGAQQQGSDSAENSKFWKTRICNKWKDGHCPYGDTCKYAHGEGDLRSPQDGGKVAGKKGEADKRTMFELMRKTRICEEFVKTGACKYGDKCTFAHGQDELRQPPANIKDAAQQQGNGGGKDTMHKTRLCERFMNTKSCPYGDKCTFAHGHHELRQRQVGATGRGQNQGAQQKQQKKQQQKGEGGGAGTSVGVKREREEDDAVDGDTQPEETAKRQNITAEGEEGQGAGNEEHDEQKPVADRAGSSGAWDWTGEGEVDGEGKAWGDADAVEQQQPEHQQELQEDAAAGDGGDDGAGGMAEGGSPAEAAGASGEAAAGGISAHGDADAANGETDTVPSASGEPECRLCARMIKSGKNKMLAAVQQLPSPAAQKLGAMILGYGMPRFEQLWHKLSFSQLQSMMTKAELPVSDRIELLKTVCFHTHSSEEQRERMESQKYLSQGLPAEVADFVAMVLDGKEGSAQMTEYFAALEVCKTLYGITEEEYYNVSSTMANLFMNM